MSTAIPGEKGDMRNGGEIHVLWPREWGSLNFDSSCHGLRCRRETKRQG